MASTLKKDTFFRAIIRKCQCRTNSANRFERADLLQLQSLNRCLSVSAIGSKLRVMSASIEALKAKLYQINALHSAIGMMDWDQQTMMPKGGAEARAEHLSILSEMAHGLSTSDEYGRAIEDAAKDAATEEEKALVRVSKRGYDHATKLPSSLVARKSKLAAQGHEEWVIARKGNDFKAFQATLTEMFEIAKEEADRFGWKDHVYDALLDLYEEGATHADAAGMFDQLRGPQSSLVKQIAHLPKPNDDFLHGKFPEDAQRAFTLDTVKAIGFDLNRGRQDTAPHPFCTGWSVGDIRLTTRFLDYLPSAIMGSMHEAGHGMYEQGSPKAWDRLPIAGGVSLGVHESQSRFWENIVGRSREFWEFRLPGLKKAFPGLDGVSLDQFVRAINVVQPSLIRVEADEMTYNLHVMVRFEIESDVLTGKLAVKDLPEAWNAKYEEYLGIRPDSDSNGCLQDVHWSMGSIGYFPTYSMGNLLSWQFWTALKKDIPDAQSQFASGKFDAVHGWLTDKIYSKGSLYTPKELVKRVTGKAISADDYLTGLLGKYRDLYSI